MKYLPIPADAAILLVQSERWQSKTQRAGRCIEWTGARSNGYGITSMDGSNRRAARVALVARLGRDLDEGMTVEHLCGNPACVNPEHLAELTLAQNLVARTATGWGGENSRRTHCPAGHPYTPDNLVAYDLNLGKRRCKKCKSNYDGRHRNLR